METKQNIYHFAGVVFVWLVFHLVCFCFVGLFVVCSGVVGWLVFNALCYVDVTRN